MESFREYIEGLKKEKEEKLEEDIIDEIADRIADKVAERLRPVVPYCFNCPYYPNYRCSSCPYHTYTIAWTYSPTYSRIPPTYSVVPTDATHTCSSWGYGEEEDE